MECAIESFVNVHSQIFYKSRWVDPMAIHLNLQTRSFKAIGGSRGQKTCAFDMKVFLVFNTPLFTELKNFARSSRYWHLKLGGYRVNLTFPI